MSKNSEFSKILENFIESTGYRLDYIANKTNVSKTAISLYKSGDRIPKDNFIEEFIQAFEIRGEYADEIKMAVYTDCTPKPILDKIKKLENRLKGE